MDFAYALQRIWQRRIWLVPVVIAAVAAGVVATHRVSLTPPSVEPRALEVGAGSIDLLVESSQYSISNLQVPVDALAERAQLYAEFLRTSDVRSRIAKAAGVPDGRLLIDGVANTGVLQGLPGQTSEVERSAELVDDQQAYRVFYRVVEEPIIRISTQAPNGKAAAALASATSNALSAYVDEAQRQQGVKMDKRITINPLGPAAGAAVNESAGLTVGILAALVTFVAGCLLILAVGRVWDDLALTPGRKQVPPSAEQEGSPLVVASPPSEDSEGRGSHVKSLPG